MDLQNPKTILIVQIGKIGDMILTTPLFSEMKKVFPQSELIILASEVNKDIPLNHLSVDKVIVFKKSLISNTSLFRYFLNKIDIWIDTKHNYSKTSSLLLRALKPKISLGYSFEHDLFTIPLNQYLTGEHAVNINLSPVHYFKNKNVKLELKPSFTIPEKIIKRFDTILENKFGENILINVSAGSPSRYLTKEKWKEIVEMIAPKGNYSFKIIGLGKDKEVIDYLLENSGKSEVSFVPTENILETSAVIRACDYVITPDTSVVHICSAFDKPVVALFPGVKWNLNKFAPLSKYNEVITSGNKNSIEDILPGQVYEGFMRLVNKTVSGNAESRTRVRKEDH